MPRLTHLAIPLTLLLSACGGGGGGGGDGGAGDGSWLTFSPNPASVVALPGRSTYLSVSAHSARTFTRPVNIYLEDLGRKTTGAPTVTAYSDVSYSASFLVSNALAPGTHTGELLVKVCFDDPLTCSAPASGSPWRVPYNILVVDPATFTLARWESVPPSPGSIPFLENYSMGAVGSALLVVDAGFYSALMETWRSDNDGLTWSKVPAAGPTDFIRRFALASDGQYLYLSGGQLLSGSHSDPLGSYVNKVWRFDGAAWELRTASAPFAGREDHAMVALGGRLYVLGGHTAAPLDDAWVSDDGGATWTKLATALPTKGGVTCAAAWKGGLVLAQNGAIWSSADGSLWTRHSGFASPYQTGTDHCAVLGERFYVWSSDPVVSSADLDTWQFEPPIWGDGFVAPGMTAANGRLFLLFGMGTSQRPVMRSVPK